MRFKGRMVSLTVAVLVLVLALSQAAGAQTLRIGHPQRPTDFNPFVVVQGIQMAVQKYVFSKLVAFDTDGFVIPDLAREWTVSADATKFTFYLREDVKWHDGVEFTADDVVFTFNYLFHPSVGARVPTGLDTIKGVLDYKEGRADRVAGVYAEGKYTVVFELDRPNAVFWSGLANQSIVPKHVVEKIPPEAFATSEFATRRPYPGTGPFIFERYVTDQFIELRANPAYFRGAPKIERLVIESIPDNNTRVVALERGELDVTEVPESETERLRSLPNIRIVTKALPVYIGLFIDSDQTKDSPMKAAIRTPQFRQALLHALDLDAIISLVMRDSVQRQLCPFRQSWACSPNLVSYEYNPEKAKRLLAEIGWNERWELDWLILGGEVGPVHAVVQQMWANVGIRTAPRAVDGPTFVENFYRNGTFDLAWVGYGTGDDPHIPANNFFVCGRIYPEGYNGTRYCNDRVTELISIGETAVDFGIRRNVYQEISEILNRELPLIPLWSEVDFVGLGPRVKQFTYDPYYWDDPHLWEVTN